MISLFILVAIIWQLFAGVLIIAPVRRDRDPAFYWLVILIETATAGFLFLRHT